MKVLAILYSGGQDAKDEPRLLGTVENALGIRDWLEKQGHEYIVTDDKEGPNSEFQKHVKDAEVLITTPFHPGYLTKDIFASAKNLKLCITAGVGSDHIDLNAANERKVTVAEVSGSNVVAVAEHVLMTILTLVRNYQPSHDQITSGNWAVSHVARSCFDLEGKVVGTLGAGRIGYRVLQRLKPFDCKELLYFDYTALPAEAEQSVGAKRVEDLHEFLSKCDIVTINAPLHEGTRDLFNAETISHMKDGAWLVNTARGAICNAQAVADAVKSGKLSGYGGDVWNVQPAPKDHPWRSMHGPLGPGFGNNMTPHMSGTSIDSQVKYANGTKEILEHYLNGTEQTPANVIVEKGDYVTKAYGERKK